MDINCINKCKHQQDGKCIMGTLPDSMPELIDGDCPYQVH